MVLLLASCRIVKLSRFDKWGSAEMYNLQILNNTSEAVFRTCDGYCWTPFVRTFVNNLGVWLGMKMINHHCLVMLFLLHKWQLLEIVVYHHPSSPSPLVVKWCCLLTLSSMNDFKCFSLYVILNFMQRVVSYPSFSMEDGFQTHFPFNSKRKSPFATLNWILCNFF